MKDKKIELLSYFNDFFESDDKNSLFDGSGNLLLSNKFEKIENEYKEKNKESLIFKRIAIISSISTDFFEKFLKLQLYKKNISPKIYSSNYDSLSYEFLNPNSQLYNFKPDAIVILNNYIDIKSFPRLFADKVEINSWINSEVNYYKNIWKKAEKISAQIFQTNFVIPISRQLGNLESNYIFSRSNCIRSLNLELINASPSFVTFIDSNFFASYMGKDRWFSEKDYFLSKQGMSFDSMGFLSYGISSSITSYFGLINKCLVLDLDNTLWGGVIGDDDIDGINLDPNDPIGEAFLSFQKYILELKERGVILAVCSKNDIDIAKSPFMNHANMVLKLDHISCFIANWEDKPKNLITIADQLNLGLDSLVFFDDNPAEREIVKKMLKDVKVVDVPNDPAYYVRTLEMEMHFDWTNLSNEDLSRTDSFVSNKDRSALESESYDYNDYLSKLEMKSLIGEVEKRQMPRFLQLLNKTNQFNFRTLRFSSSEINKYKKTPERYKLLYISLKDKFTDYGIISCLITQKIDSMCFIDSWVMSCRVFNRELEKMIINELVKIAQKWGCTKLYGQYIPTKKNKLIKDLYLDLGFKKTQKKVVSNVFEDKYDIFELNTKKSDELNHRISLTSIK